MNRNIHFMAAISAIALGISAQHPAYAQNVASDVLLPNPYPYIATTNPLYPEWFHSVYLAQRTKALNDFNTQLQYPTVVSESLSPPFFFKRSAYDRYNLKNRLVSDIGVNNPNIYLAHRGLVNLNAGVLENTFDSVAAARTAGIGMVEIDIQAGLDGKAYVTHDDSLYRTTGVDADVNIASTAQLNADVYAPVPTSATARARRVNYGSTRTDCDGVGERLMDLSTMYQYLNQNGYDSTCPGKQELMYFLDPKNLASGIAGMKFVASLDSVGRSRFYMKTYDGQWSTTGTASAALLKAGLGTVSNVQQLTVMPVINIRAGYLDNAALSSTEQISRAVDYAASILAAYSTQGFQIGAVEFPGAWDVKWQTFVTAFYDKIRDYPEVYFKNNPLATKYSSGFIYSKKPMPVLAYGYRFPDFKIAGTKYTWSMQGYPQVDTVNSARATLGAQAVFTRELCEKRLWFIDSSRVSNYQTGCFVTHDFPHYENAAATNQTVSTFIGAPQTTLSQFSAP
jgi:Glycerophosphoryl diester phosphodiesterase family